MIKMNLPSCIGVESMYLKICRCCLEKDCSKAISSDCYVSGKKKLYGNMFKDVFNIQFTQEFLSMEQYICENCIMRLRDASLFKDMVIKNEEMYIEYLKSQFGNEVNDSSSGFKIENVKLEESMDMKCDHDQDDSIDDNEILPNLKYEGQGAAILENSNKQMDPKKSKFKKKEKVKDIETEELRQDLSKSDHRGSGPVLRENSLKLLANSTATIFQWNISRYRCFCCKEPFSDIDMLKAHANTHTLQDIQKKIIKQQNRLVKVEISSLNCKLCQKQLADLDDLKKHLLEHSIVVSDHLLVPFKLKTELKCQICSESFTLFRLLNIHMNKHYQKHVCYVCGAGFSNLVFLNLHRSRSHRPIQCQKCNITFLSRTEKKQHDTEHHGVKQVRKNRFPCPFCQERFFQENLKVKHLVEKHGMKKPEFSCQFCSKSFITRSLVNNHVKTVHMKEKNHECDICHYLFYTKSDVVRHRVSHTGEKNYSCTLCTNPFASRDSLRRHMKRTHTAH